MDQDRSSFRLVVLLLVATAVGVWLLFTRFKSSENRFGGIGRYQGRGSNEQAWKPYAHLKHPPYQAVLGNVCGWAPPGMDCGKILLPSDQLHHVLVTFREHDNDGEPSLREPVEMWAKALQQEWDIPLHEKIDRNSTLAEVVEAWNQLSQERQRRYTSDSLDRARGTQAPVAQ